MVPPTHNCGLGNGLRNTDIYVSIYSVAAHEMELTSVVEVVDVDRSNLGDSCRKLTRGHARDTWQRRQEYSPGSSLFTTDQRLRDVIVWAGGRCAAIVE